MGNTAPEKNLELVLLTLRLTKWTGKATFSLDHLDLKSTPDKEVYKDGKICLIDPKTTNVFEAIKKRMEASCAAYRYRLPNGPWVIPFARWDELEAQLNAEKSAFDNAVAEFVAAYPANTQAWIDTHQKDADFIRTATPGSRFIEERFALEWYPTPCEFSNPAFEKYRSGFEKGLAWDLAEEVSKVAQHVLGKLSKAKRSVVGVADLQKLRRKVEGLVFLRPEFKGVVKHLDQLLQTISDVSVSTEDGLSVGDEMALTGLLNALIDPVVVLEFGNRTVHVNPAPTNAPQTVNGSVGVRPSSENTSNARSAGRSMF